MKLLTKLNITFFSFILVSCTTSDFKVVEALETGMSKQEARSTIASYAFQREQIIERPDNGWPKSDGTITNLPGRANAVENTLNIDIRSAEYYPVGHGLLGFGQLFLFYDNNDRLVHYYRKQIN